jgi:hypothetical protein
VVFFWGREPKERWGAVVERGGIDDLGGERVDWGKEEKGPKGKKWGEDA